MFKSKFKKRVLFVGMPDMAYICLEGLKHEGVNIVGVIGAKKNHPTYLNFKNFVNQHQLNFLEYDNLDDKEFIERIQALKPDIAVVCSFNYKIPKVLLELVKEGFINIHPSILPKYRGPNPYSAVIINKEAETGVTLHFMDDGFDTGDIIVQKIVPILPIETMGTLFNRLNVIAFDLLLETLKKYESEQLPRKKQPQGIFEVAPIFPESALFINYEKPAIEANNLIRALNPFILARTNFRNNLVKILSADILEEDFSHIGSIGEIVKIEDDKFYVATGKGLLAPTSMQFGSFFVGTSKEFIKILDPKIGEKFS